jgi:hypothetical protein
MPRLVHKNPTYRKHRASGQAIVTIDGKDLYFGRTVPKRAVSSTTASSESGWRTDGGYRLRSRSAI